MYPRCPEDVDSALKAPATILSLAILMLLASGGGSARSSDSGHDAPSHRLRAAGPSPLDSARDEMKAGRFWHATRILRAAGAADGSPAEVLLLARAEAGWKDWSQVLQLLDGVGWLNDQAQGEGWRLLGRAEEEEGRWPQAAHAYGAYLAHAAADDSLRLATTVRRARALARSGSDSDAVAALAALPAAAAPARSWTALDLLGPAVEDGDTARVQSLMSLVTDPNAAAAAWLDLPRARAAAGDTMGALAAYRAVASSNTGRRRAEARVQEGLLLMAGGHEAEARPPLLAGLDSAPRVAAARAAAALVDAGGNSRTLLLRLAPLLDRIGDGGRALDAYDRAHADAAKAGVKLPGWARLARARLMATVRDRQPEALEEFRALYASTKSERIGARTLDVWAEMRHSQGRSAEEKTLRRWLLERYPSSPEAVDVLWTRAREAEARGDVKKAVEGYATLIRHAPDVAQAGEARMRMAQIELANGEVHKAARVYRDYLREFPNGRRWAEASYWAARLDLRLGDSTVAHHLVARIRRAEPISYYAVIGADLLHEPYAVSFPPGEPVVEPMWLAEGLQRLDLLHDAGLTRGANAEESRLVRQARGSRSALLSLAEALVKRGRTVTAINLGWDLRQEGEPWTRQLLQVVYPFPYEELVRREAAEWGVDPIMLAALIRQESAFAADVVSGAGAVGLMQVMPPTGRQLARAHGPRSFTEAILTTPEVNLHLGAAFFVEMSRRYGGDLPLVLAAYNAGPTRATRWRRYAKGSDPLRFTERIPIAETRGYVKSVTRNVSVYQALYGDE